MSFTFYYKLNSEMQTRSFTSDSLLLRPEVYKDTLLKQKAFHRKRHQGPKEKEEEFVVSLFVSDGENAWRPVIQDELIKNSMVVMVKRLPADYASGRLQTVSLTAAYPTLSKVVREQNREETFKEVETEEDRIEKLISIAGKEETEKLDPVTPLYEDAKQVPKDANYICHVCQQRGHERKNCPIANDGLTGKACDKVTAVMRTLPSGIPMEDLDEVSPQNVNQAEYKTAQGKFYKRKISEVANSTDQCRCTYCCNRKPTQKLGTYTTIKTPCCQKSICKACYQWAGFDTSLTVCLKCKKTVWK